MNEQPRPTDGSQAIIRLTERQYDAMIRERDQLREQLKGKNEEQARKLAAISVCALSNTQRARTEQGLPLHPSHELYTAAYSDVERLVTSEMKLREQLRLANEDAVLFHWIERTMVGMKWADLGANFEAMRPEDSKYVGDTCSFKQAVSAHRERTKGAKQ